jgi:hypothetical protein
VISYLDSSALVKLLVEEEHSRALGSVVLRSSSLASSALARTELLRAVTRYGAVVAAEAGQLLAELELVPLTDTLLDRAGALRVPEVPFLRSLDAIHLVSAGLLGDVELLTYDDRMADAARAMGLTVSTPRD